MAYISISDLRAEGVATEDYSNEYLEGRITLAQEFIEQVTGRFFEVKNLTLTLSGRGHDTLLLPHSPISGSAITEIKISGEVLSSDYYTYKVDVLPGVDDRYIPKVMKLAGVWPRKVNNVTVTGDFGFVDTDGGEPPTYSTPPLVKRLCILISIHEMPLASRLAGGSSGDIIEEQLGDYRYRLSEVASLRGGMFSDPRINNIMSIYKPKDMRAL